MTRAQLPEVLRMAHEEVHEEMVQATRLGGETEIAARAVVRVLFPHVLLEEEFGIPPLTLLPRLARGEFSPDMSFVLRWTDLLKAELPRMLDEHKQIVEALRVFLRTATAEKHTGYARLAQKLILHAQLEEEVLYPASILVGEYVKLKLGRS
jgi:hypothetical protein